MSGTNKNGTASGTVSGTGSGAGKGTEPESGRVGTVEEVERYVKRLGFSGLEDVSPPSEEKLFALYQRTVQRIPYSSIRFVTQADSERRVPTPKEAWEEGLKMNGGTCYCNNVFFSQILGHLGYDVCYMLGSIFTPLDTPNHVIVVVTLNGQRYLLDTAASISVCGALIPLPITEKREVPTAFWPTTMAPEEETPKEDPKNSEDPEKSEGSDSRKLEKSDTVIGVRVLVPSKEVLSAWPREADGWTTYLRFKCKFYELHELPQYMDKVYKTQKLAPPLFRLTLWRYPCLSGTNKHVLIRHGRSSPEIVIADASGTQSTTLASDDKYVKAVLEHFGDVLDETSLRRAITYSQPPPPSPSPSPNPSSQTATAAN